MTCKICYNDKENHQYEASEMMYGISNNIFIYFQCSVCDCLQIAEIPSDMARYYPADYYSYSPSKGLSPIRKILRRLRNDFVVGGNSLLGRLVYSIFPSDLSSLRSLAVIKPRADCYILDVGCGSGDMLSSLRELGYKNLLGIDPYIQDDIEYGNGLKIQKKGIHELIKADNKWDIIMFHHSFEHMPDPVETLISAAQILTDDGVCLVRVPTVSSYAWKHYGVNWVQLDAPRHLFLYSVQSINILAGKAGLKLDKVVYDSTDLQLWGSEQCAQNIPLRSARSYATNPSNSIFTEKEIKKYKKEAIRLNEQNQGDQAAFYLRKQLGPKNITE